MINGAERVGDSSEINTEQQKHPLEQMPSFEEHMQQFESSETSGNPEQISAVDDALTAFRRF